MRFRIVQRHAEHHGGKRPLSQITAIVLHETEGHNAGDYSTLLHGGPRHVSVGYWIPDYNDTGAAEWIKDGTYIIVQFLPLSVAGNSVGEARVPYGNANTVSIEMGHIGSELYGEAQLEALDWLIAHIDHELGRQLPLKTHAEIALPKGRKSDPGRTFPLAGYKAWRQHAKPVITKRVIGKHMARRGWKLPGVLVPVYRVKDGQIVTLIGVSGDWGHVKNAAGLLAWLPLKMLKD